MGNQTAKRDEGKLMLSLVPTEPIEAVAAIRMYGNEKYHDPDNWKTVEKQRYVDAAFRHFIAYLREPYGMDGESNLPHLWHCLCNFFFLCSLETQDGTLPTAQDALKKMHHPAPVEAPRSPEVGEGGYLFADDIRTPPKGVHGLVVRC